MMMMATPYNHDLSIMVSWCLLLSKGTRYLFAWNFTWLLKMAPALLSSWFIWVRLKDQEYDIVFLVLSKAWKGK